MDRAKYAEMLLEYEIAALEAERIALAPKGWDVPGLAQSYAEAFGHAALIGVWEGEKLRFYEGYEKALEDHAYGVKKLDHLYI